MRVMIAGTGSGCGKTTVSILLMRLLTKAGLRVAPYKVGPDYVDTGFHRAVCDWPSYNLDSFLLKEGTLRALLKNERDISVIEGVMGFYDGLDIKSLKASSWQVALNTNTPVILTVDASGSAASVAAVVKGFMSLTSVNMISGVIVNRVSGDRHYQMVKQAVEHYTGIKCLGYLDKQQALELPSRQLGLVPAGETPRLIERIDESASHAAKTLDIEGIKRVAAAAPVLDAGELPAVPRHAGFRLGVAMDEAFCFYYQANLDALKRAGMELIFFSPIRDEKLPEGLDALYIGGGYPEVFKEALSANTSMRRSIKRALENGLKCYAECGGLMYLSGAIDGLPMVGFLPCECVMTPHLKRFGYVNVEDETGLCFPAHEFHHAQAQPEEGARFAYRVSKASDPARAWQCGYTRLNTLAAFAHVYFADRPELIKRFFA